MRLLPAKFWPDAVPLIALLLAACGGGGGATNSTTPVLVATYSVGGTVTGLTPGNSITITNNGTDNLTLSGASGVSQTFTFATKLPNGATYKLTLSTTSPNSVQPCTSIYGTGVVNGADVPGINLPGMNVFCGLAGGSNRFTATGNSMTTARYNHAATLLPNGQVLVSGGQGTAGVLPSAELYDPVAGVWVTANQMTTARYNHTATLLPNGKVLVSGGLGMAGSLPSAELYDPATGLWATAASMNIPRYSHTATLLPNGKVLVSGGYNGLVALTSAELYDPATGLWTATASMKVPRYSHTATLLPNGKVLVSGGYSTYSGVLSSAELYNPASETWTATASMNVPRYSHTATLLPDGRALPNGKVLVSGGHGATGAINSAELYDPVSGAWTYAALMSESRYLHTATLLPNGSVLVSGGYSTYSGAILGSAELYYPYTGTWIPNAYPLVTPREFHTATLLLDGKVLISGGQGPAGAHRGAELYF